MPDQAMCGKTAADTGEVAPKVPKYNENDNDSR